MRGSLKQRYRGHGRSFSTWGMSLDPDTGKPRRKQKWHTFRGTRKQAEDKLTYVLKAAKDGTYVDASKITLGEWLTEWFTASKMRFRASTCERFEGIISKSLHVAPIARMPLQKVRPTHLEQYYASSSVSASTLTLHHTILHQALRKAARIG